MVVRDGEVVADESATLPGRGAWVHPTRDCVQSAIDRRAFGRALRTDGPLDTARILAQFPNVQLIDTVEAATAAPEETG